MHKAVYNCICNLDKLCRRVPPKGDLPDNRTLIHQTLKVAIPSIVESFLIAVVSMVDTYMVSNVGDHAISAVGLTTQPKFATLAIFIAISTAVSALVARRRGEGKLGEASRILQQALLLSMVLTAAITVLATVFARPIMLAMGAQPDTIDPATDYFRIISFGMVFNIVTLVINAAQRGVGNTAIAMKTNVVSNLVNVACNFLLIEGRWFFPRLEVRGAAYATVLGTIIAMLMALRSVTRPDGYLSLVRGFTLKVDRAVMHSLLKLGSPTLVEQVFMRTGFILYFMLIARLGTAANAAHNIGMNFTHISFSFAEGLSVAAVALVGRSLGQKRSDLALYYSSICQRLGFICSILVALVYVPFGRRLFALFSDNPVIQEYGAQLMTLIAVIVFIQITMVIFVSCLRAAGDVKYVAVISFVCIALIRPSVAYLFCYPLGLGLVGAWMGMFIDQGIRLILSYLRYRKGNWVNIKI